MGSQAVSSPKLDAFRIFIGYASEDRPLASAVAACFKTALPESFAEVNQDYEFLQPGSPFKDQIASKLKETDVLILVYSGVEKPSHSFTGWEVGYFDHILSVEPGRRKKISLYLYGPPATTAQDQGIDLGLSKEELRLPPKRFEDELTVSPDEPLCKEIEAWQERVERNVEAAGLARPHRRPEQNAAQCVRKLKLEVFAQLKGTVEDVVRRQRQITISVKRSSLELALDRLPPDACISPMGPTSGGAMSTFGLGDKPISWGEFIKQTAGSPFSDSWQQAITSVVLSAFPDRVDVDNSQHILASDGRTEYRVILSSATKYHDDHYDYNLYFVEFLRPPDLGNRETTLLLKGLELVCRFRSMFLEKESEFRGEIIGVTDPLKLHQVAGNLLRGLDRMHRDALDAGVDQPALYAKYVEVEHLEAMAKAYRPAEAKLRELIGEVLTGKADVGARVSLRDQMAETLTNMETAIRPENALLLREMSAQLNKIVACQEEENTAQTK